MISGCEARARVEAPPAERSSAVDPEVRVAEVMVELEAVQATRARAGIARAKSSREQRLAAAAKALARARASSKRRGFWAKVGSVAKKVGVVAAIAGGVAGAAFTGGGSLVLGVAVAGAVLSAGAFAMKETGVDAHLGRLGCGTFQLELKLSDTVGLAGAALSGGAGLAAGGATSGSTLAGAVSGAVQGGAKGVAGYSAVREGHAGAAELGARADGARAEAGLERASAEQQEHVELLRSVTELRARAFEAVSQAQQQRASVALRLSERGRA